ncbi:MAG TPA: TolC family protein [Candidatus Obscuribacterales bacterium]
MTPSFLPTHSRAFRRILATGCAFFVVVAPVAAADSFAATSDGPALPAAASPLTERTTPAVLQPISDASMVAAGEAALRARAISPSATPISSQQKAATSAFHAPTSLLGSAPPMMQSTSTRSTAGGSFLAQSSADSLLNIPAGPPTAQPNDQTSIDEIMKGTVTSPSMQALPAMQGPNQMQPIALPELPPEITDHNKNKTIDLGPLHMGPLIQIATLRPIKLDANYTQPVTLRDSLVYALRNSLPIRINYQTFQSNRYAFYGALGGFLPSLTSAWTYTHSHIFPDTESNSRIYSEQMAIPVFQGGRIMYGMLGQLYRWRASHNQYDASINDTLLNTYNAYYNLLLQRALLQIRIKSVEVSEAQLKLNEQLYLAGTGTRFAVMQSRTQLALDRQALLQQQVQVRIAALQLAFDINMPLGINIIPTDNTVTESSLLDEGININELLNLSIVHRPELRQYEWLKMAAERSVQVAAAPLYPTAQWTITYSHSSTSVNGPSNTPKAEAASVNQQLVNSSRSSGTTTTTTSQPVSANGGATGVSPTSNPSAGGATGITTPSSQVAASSTNITTPTSVVGGGGGGSFSSSSTTQNVPAVGVFGGKFNTVSFSFNLSWTLGQLGTTAAANILSARSIARQAYLQCNQVLLQVSQQVRSAYLNALTAREQIDVTATGVASSAEELRLANLRVQMGVGTNLELIQAQRDYIQALINQAQAIIASNQAQAQLLHDAGIISVETLTAGFKRPISSTGNTTH